MATKVQVYRDPDGTRWAARMVGDEETEPRFFDSRDEAIAEGRRRAADRGVELVIHDESGEAEEKDRPAG
jgi:hypothetical protein